MPQYYTLEEVAKILQVTPDKVREMVRLGKIRGFPDGRTLRFKSKDVEELARSMGLGSEPELQLGEAPPQKPGNSGTGSGKRKQGAVPNMNLEEEPKKPAASGGGRKPTMVKPPVGSDSDVRLVVEDFDLEDEPAPARSEKKSDKKPATPDSGLKLLPIDEDSDVKLVPDEEAVLPPSGTGRRNSGAKTPSDSDIRLGLDDEDEGSGDSYEPIVTEEIDLDAEEQKSAELKAASQRKKSELKQPKKSELKQPRKSELKQPKPGNSASKLPTSSPFELSEDEIVLAPEDDGPTSGSAGQKSSVGKKNTPGKSSAGKKQAGLLNMSLDEPDDAPLILEPEDGSDEIGLGLEPRDDAGQSGINLQDPADSGPTLEDDGSSDMELALGPLDSGASKSSRSSKSNVGKKKSQEDESSEFELTLDEEDASGVDSSSEFELTLDEDAQAETTDSSSEFELSLDEDGSASSSNMESSDSEFELTLDDDDAGVDLAPIDEGDEKDIFETNLDVPALDDESASEAVPLESTEEMDGSSEFELDLDGDSGEGDEETGSQVVPLDEDEADEGDETVAKTVNRRGGKPKGRPLADFADEGDEDDTPQGDYEDLDEMVDEDEEAVRPAAAASGEPVSIPWGPLPALMLVPTVIVLFVVGLMSYELVRGMWGYQKGTRVSQMLIKPIAEMFGDKLPD